MVTEILEDDDNLLENEITVLHVGAPTHSEVRVRPNERTFSNVVVRKKGSSRWPPRSPDLTPANFFR